MMKLALASKTWQRFATPIGLVLSVMLTLPTAGCDSNDSDSDSESTDPDTKEDPSDNDEDSSDEGSTQDEESNSDDSSTSGDESTSTDDPDLVDLALSDDRFSTLVTALQAADLVDALRADGPLTVFAPTNAAFEALPEGALDELLQDKDKLREVLLHHVIAGNVASTDLPDVPYTKSLADFTLLVDLSDGVKISGATVEEADIAASNGMLHVMSDVILPPAGTIVDIAASDENFSTLVTAVTEAGLADTLAGDGPFTVFAPTNAAFDALPEGTLESLLDDKEALTNVLLYHVVGAEAYSADLEDGASIETLLEDQSLSVELGSEVKIGDATVTMVDILATNGVIHVIDAVLIPNAD